MVYLLLGILMSGQMVVIDVLPSKQACEYAREYIGSLDERPARVYCIKVSTTEL